MIIVATATAKEMKAALGFAQAPAVEQGEALEFSLGDHSLLLTVTGVGLVNSALAIGRFLGRPGVTGVVNLGIAGAYDLEEFPMCSVTYAWQETWPEYGVLDQDGRVDPKALGFAQGHIDGEPVWNRVKLVPVNDAEAMGVRLGEKWGRAAALSVNSVTSMADRAGWLKTAYNSDIENMEGFSLAFAAKQKGMPFLEVRTISNLVGSRDVEDWDLKGAFGALGKCAQYLFTGK